MKEFVEHNGATWKIVDTGYTSDGYVLGLGRLLDEDGGDVFDDEGFPVIHTFFMGRAGQGKEE